MEEGIFPMDEGGRVFINSLSALTVGAQTKGGES